MYWMEGQRWVCVLGGVTEANESGWRERGRGCVLGGGEDCWVEGRREGVMCGIHSGGKGGGA